MDDKFTWVETYSVLARNLRKFRHQQTDLLDFLNILRSEGLSTINTTDKDQSGQEFPLAEIDPFTFFANFNRGLRTETRIEIIRRLLDRWQLSCRYQAISQAYQ